MTTLKETKEKILTDAKNWCVYLMDFVDDFRYYKDLQMISEPFELSDDKMDALLASTTESLCDEMNVEPPEWLKKIPACKKPYFVGEIERLKAISIVQSPLRFKVRNIFVLENFLSRV